MNKEHLLSHIKVVLKDHERNGGNWLSEAVYELALNTLENNWQQRAQAAEAKLAELEKQEPEYEMFTGHGWMQISKEHYEGVEKNKGSFRVVFTRPAPAINLAELVPEIEPYCHGLWPYAVKALEDYRAAILRNIEEKSK